MRSVTKFDIWSDTQPVAHISELIDELRYTASTLEESVCEEIVTNICNDGKQYATILNSIAPQSGVEKSIVGSEVYGSKGELYLQGKSAVYDEFGTGEEGAFNPHPLKNNFGLNPYNSGPFVSTHVDKYGQHFWFYTPMRGKPYFFENGLTYGIPSGKQMYNTLQHINQIKANIVVDEINKAIRTLK